MTQYIIDLTETENKALSYVAVDQETWIENVVHDRCRIAIDDIVKIGVEKALQNNIQIPGTKEEIVDLAFVQGWVVPLADQQVSPPASVEAPTTPA